MHKKITVPNWISEKLGDSFSLPAPWSASRLRRYALLSRFYIQSKMSFLQNSTKISQMNLMIPLEQQNSLFLTNKRVIVRK